MSLKAFHIVFIVVSTLFSVGMGAWSVRHSMYGGGGAIYSALAAAAFLAAIGLVVYGKAFLEKMKDVSYL